MTPVASSESDAQTAETASIRLFELSAQNQGLAQKLDAAFERVRSRGAFILGEEVEAFERKCCEFLGLQHAVGVSNGSDALFLALLALGIGPGHEVITTPFTFIATGEAILRTGATPVFADIDPVTLCLSPERVATMFSTRTRAVIYVHLYGNPGPIADVAQLCAERNVFLVEDACQAFGASCSGRFAGAFGDIGCFSFFPTKPLGGLGDGGLCTTKDRVLHARLVSLRSHGQSQLGCSAGLGGNFRLDALQAALLSEKLPQVDSWRRAREVNARRYSDALLGCPSVNAVPVAPDSVRHAYALTTVRVPSGRDQLMTFLAQRGIESRVYYPMLLSEHALFGSHCRRDALTQAERASREVLSLPNYYGLSVNAQERVIREVLTWAARGHAEGSLA